MTLNAKSTRDHAACARRASATRLLLRSLLALICGVTVAAHAPQTPPAAPSGPMAKLPDTSDRAIPFADQMDPNYSDKLVEFIAKHYAGTQKMLKQDNDRFRAENPNWVLLHYRLAVSAGPAQYIHRNLWSSDWSAVNPHDDWFLHNEKNQRHHNPQSNWDLLDVMNPAVRDYWANSVIADMRATGSDGVFADSFEAGVSGYGITPPDARFSGQAPIDPQAWKGGRTWAEQKNDFADDMMRRFKATPEKFLFVPNLGGLTTSWWWPDYSKLDGAMLEGFALNDTFADWVVAMNRALELTRPGKFVILQAYPKDDSQRMFLFGSYLLLKGRHTFINAAGAGVYYFPEYDMSFGPAKDPLPADVSAYAWNRIYKREFRDAIVLVNPRNESVTVTLTVPVQLASPDGGGATADAQIDDKRSYVGGTMSYSDIKAVTVGAHTAVLLKRK